MNDEQLDRLGMAVGNVEAAIETTPEVRDDPRPRPIVVGDALVFALALKGFVLRDDPVEARRVIEGWGGQDRLN